MLASETTWNDARIYTGVFGKVIVNGDLRVDNKAGSLRLVQEILQGTPPAPLILKDALYYLIY